MYFLLHSTVQYKLGALGLLLRLKSREHLVIQLLWTTVQLLVTSVSPIYLVDEESQLLFLLIFSYRPTEQRTGWRNLVCVEYL